MTTRVAVIMSEKSPGSNEFCRLSKCDDTLVPRNKFGQRHRIAILLPQQRSVSVGGARFRTVDGRQVRVKSLGF